MISKIAKITKYSIIALLLLSLLITSTAHAYAPVATAVARALANKQLRNLVIGSGLLVGGGGTVLNDIFGGDYNPDTPAPPPANNGGSNTVWITNGLDGSRSMSPQGSCNLLNEGHGVKLTHNDGSYRCTVYSPNLGRGYITYSTYQVVGDVWQNPKLADIADDIVSQAKQGNNQALDIIRASEPPAPFDIDNASNDEIIKWLNNNQADNSTTDTTDPANSSGPGTGTGTGGTADPANSSGAGTGGNTDPANGGGGTADKFQLPKFCDWASWFCDDVKLSNEPPPTKNIELKSPESFDKDYISTNAQCPADVVRTFSTGFSQSEIRFEFKPICDFAKDYIRPVVIFLAYLSAVLTISSGFKIG